MLERYKRQSGLINHEDLDATNITLVGAGGIGGVTAVFLTKMGCDPKVYDFDEIEEHNIANQLYGPNHLGVHKVDALRDAIKLLDDKEITVKREKFARGSGDILILGVDSIPVREEIYNENKDNFEWLIDGRMGGQTGEVFVVNLNDEKAKALYEQHFHKDPMEIPCTERATIYCSAVIGGTITASVKHIVKKESPGYRRVFMDMVNMTTDDLTPADYEED